MNVIIYTGSETNPKSVDNTLALLSSLALPNYTVQLLPKVSFIREPWEIGCKLFVIPYLGSSSSAVSDSPNRSLDIFGQKEVKRLRAFVEQDGGAVLGIGLGAHWEAASAGALERAMFSLNLSLSGGAREDDVPEPLKFHDKGLASFILPQVNTTILKEAQPVAGGDGSPLDVTAAKIVPPGTPEEVSSLNIVRPIGKGHVAFIRPTLTTPLSEVSERLVSLLHTTISQLGLTLPALGKFAGFSAPSTASGPPSPLPQFLTSIPSTSPGQPTRPIVSTIRQCLFPSSSAELGKIKDTTDTFVFVSLGSDQALNALKGTQGDDDNESSDKVVIVCPDGTIPPKEQTPKFDIALYYDSLRKLKGEKDRSDGWGIGEALLYSERVTSTQTMFDR
jgi:biotin---protein ligase